MKWICAALLTVAVAFSCIGCLDWGKDRTEQENPAIDNPCGGVVGQDPENPDDRPKTDPEQEETPAWAENFDLPDSNAALEKLNVLYGGSEKVFLLQNGRIARMPCPRGETITLNVTFDMGEYTKLVFEDSVAEFNEVFAAINPNYKFAINYDPADEDLAAKYSVRLSASDNLAVTETSTVFGLAHVSYYNNFTELGDFGITIKSEVYNNGSYLMTTFKHELMHLLGAGDAYKNSDATKATVMQSYTVSGYHHLSATDVEFLDILYRNPEFEESEDIRSYIDGYEEDNAHTKTKLTASVFNKLVANLDPQTVLSEAEAIGYKDLTGFASTAGGGIIPDTTFGSKNVSFTEIEYAQTPSETYFGSIDPQEGRYCHGRQTTLGSSQGVRYVDYGGGILYAAPNGNLYTIMIKTGDFVLAFRLTGSFTNFPDLSLTLWHISK